MKLSSNPFSILTKRIYGRIQTEFSRVGKYSKEDAIYWEGLKDKYAGQRGFVIGNGPSLKANDLDKLTNDITIASNKIYLIFDQTDWRPTIYTAADKILWPKIRSVLDDLFNVIHIPDYLNSSGLKNCRYWKSPFSFGKKNFSSNVVKGAYGGHTVTYENIQIAAHLGLNPIYLIGCDHNYDGEEKSAPGLLIKQGSKQTHFIKNYRKPGEPVLPAAIEKMEESYRCAEASLKKINVDIFNATRGGQLEIFQRINLDELLLESDNDGA